MHGLLNSLIIRIIIPVSFAAFISACGGGTTEQAISDGGSGSPSDTGDTGGQPAPNPPAPGNSNVTLNWTAPDSYVDGSILNDLVGHNVYMKVGSGQFEKIYTSTSTTQTTHIVQNLTNGQYTFAVTAYNSNGTESAFSEPQSISL